MMYVAVDDFRQVGVIAKNEFRKFVRGRKILLYILLVGLIVALNVYFLNGSVILEYFESMDKSDLVLYLHTSSVSFLVLIGAVLFASYTIVSEFEERTYLLLFTRPVKKTSIFVGKFLACYAIVTIMVLIYYGISALHSFAVAGAVSSAMGYTLFLTLIDIFALSGMAMLFSTLVKRGSVSALMTFFVILMVPSIILALMIFKDPLLMSGGTAYQLENYWYLINVAESAIPEVVLNINLSLAMPILSMFLWGAIPLTAAWAVFLNKEV